MPPVPPMPSVRWGKVGSTPPMGIKQYSSSSMDFTRMPRCAILQGTNPGHTYFAGLPQSTILQGMSSPQMYFTGISWCAFFSPGTGLAQATG